MKKIGPIALLASNDAERRGRVDARSNRTKKKKEDRVQLASSCFVLLAVVPARSVVLEQLSTWIIIGTVETNSWDALGIERARAEYCFLRWRARLVTSWAVVLGFIFVLFGVFLVFIWRRLCVGLHSRPGRTLRCSHTAVRGV